MTLGNKFSIFAQAGREKLRQTACRMGSTKPGWFSRTNIPERLLLAPQDLRTPDPTAARDIYSGRYFLAGKLVDCETSNPFVKTGVPVGWQQELHSFGWLRHLEAEGSAVTKSNAQALISDWLKLHSRPRDNIAWQPETVAKRLIYWLCHSVPVVETANPRFYQAWMKSIGQHINFLKYRAAQFPDGQPRLTARIALAYAANCVSGQNSRLAKVQMLLDDELALQISEDGGHVSRNAAVIADLLALLLPLRQSYARLGIAPSQTLVSSIDRLMAALKFHRMGDGNLARYNGVSAGRPELLSTVLFYDDSMGKASDNARFSGFQRLAMGDTVLIADTGAPPPLHFSQHASAGTLSFEMSSGANLVMINCGAPTDRDGKLALVSRSTAAHNTAAINNTSSSRFYDEGRFAGLLKGKMISRPGKVHCERIDTVDTRQFTASHDGYFRNFGIIHTRTITMKNGGRDIEGTDEFSGSNQRPVPAKHEARYDIRFHLHPSISAGKTDNGKSILMMAGSGLVWKLTCHDCQPELHESIFLASSSGPKRTTQIVLSGDARDMPAVRWILVKQDNLR